MMNQSNRAFGAPVLSDPQSAVAPSLVRGEDISAFVLTYNHVHAIESTLASILVQTVSGYEVIVSDDCSTDGTWEKLLELAVRDNRIKPIRTPKNLGMAGNANFAVSQSTRPYIALLHHDDLYRQDLLEKWADILVRYPDVSFVFNGYDGQPPEFPTGRMDGTWFLEKAMFIRWGCPVRGTAMIRRSCWEAVGGMREQFNLLADVDLWMRLAHRWAVGYVADPIIKVRFLRPDYYPDIYTGKEWHWRRLTYLYEIHAQNRLSHYDLGSVSGRLKWWKYRIRMNSETAKWLAYGLIKRKPAMLTSSDESITAYDFWLLRAMRAVLKRTAI